MQRLNLIRQPIYFIQLTVFRHYELLQTQMINFGREHDTFNKKDFFQKIKIINVFPHILSVELELSVTHLKVKAFK